jgi:hypothetical protein
VEDEQLKDLLRSLPDNPIAYGRVVEALFNASSSSTPQTSASNAATGLSAAAAWGGGGDAGGVTTAIGGGGGVEGSTAAAAAGAAIPLAELPGVPMITNVDVVDAVVKVVRDVATCHGAISMSSTLLGVAHPAAPKDAVRLLSPSGTQVWNGAFSAGYRTRPSMFGVCVGLGSACIASLFAEAAALLAARSTNQQEKVPHPASKLCLVRCLHLCIGRSTFCRQ